MNEPGGTPNVRRARPATTFAHAGELIERSLTAARAVLAAHDAHPVRAQAS